jgi:TonB family protein
MRRAILALLFPAVFFVSVGWSQETSPAPIELSEDSAQPVLIRKVAPVYPPLARQARIQAPVILKIVINKDGDVRDVQLYSGHPMLAPAAVEAVKQWKYQPYTKDGEVVEVSTMVRVNFKLPEEPAAAGAVAGESVATGGTVASRYGAALRVSEAEMRAHRIQQIDPVYPALAIQKKVQGPVVLDARISAAGEVQDVIVIGGPPMLTAAAIEAVKQWKYRPYVTNGNAIAVIGMVRLHFALTENDTSGVITEPALLDTIRPTSLEGRPTAVPQRVRVSSGVSQGMLLSKVAPEYPQEAREQHVQGTVILQVRIDKEGNVLDVELISGNPMLVPAAIEAVRQWKYRPYVLNGQAVEVDTQVQVNFVLQ